MAKIQFWKIANPEPSLHNVNSAGLAKIQTYHIMIFFNHNGYGYIKSSNISPRYTNRLTARPPRVAKYSIVDLNSRKI